MISTGDMKRGATIELDGRVYQVMEFARRWSTHDRLMVGISVYSLCVLQFAALFYSPRKQLPNDRDVTAGRRRADVRFRYWSGRHGWRDGRRR